ncbi:hypothetical protein I6E61_10335 [Psychrobacter sp. NZS113]|uniref:hypothetical protein n=1 Tax=Psychrobacter sp. NZS113 TaxID=2792045 RepID=UPI0018CE2B5A|nr:hypothetical protein [Psychrobacter sp. NZS113]MBH0096783.1 hypothetical protein [Psychrobacter sp. NZS113]
MAAIFYGSKAQSLLRSDHDFWLLSATLANDWLMSYSSKYLHLDHVAYKYLSDNEKQIYISSAFDGWVYVINSIESQLDLLDNVVANFYAFGSYRIVGFVAWKQVENSQIIRHFAYTDGEVLVNIGSQTPEEKHLGFVNLSGLSNSEATEVIFNDENLENDLIVSMLDEDNVISVCNEWTEKDPSRFDELTINAEDFPEKGVGGIIKTT